MDEILKPILNLGCRPSFHTQTHLKIPLKTVIRQIRGCDQRVKAISD